jgi:hypothetical protein
MCLWTQKSMRSDCCFSGFFCYCICCLSWGGLEECSRYSDLLCAGRCGIRCQLGEFFRTRPHRSWGPSYLLYSAYRIFPGGKVAGTWQWPPIPSSAEVKERAQLYLYFPSGPSSPILGWTWLLPYGYIERFPPGLRTTFFPLLVCIAEFSFVDVNF